MSPLLLYFCLGLQDPAPKLDGPLGQSAAPASRAEAVAGAVEWLVAHQNRDGSWGGPQSPRPIEVLANVPGSHQAFQVATSAMCVMALARSPYQTEAARAARDRGLDFLLRDYDVKRPNGMEHYNVWAFGYGLQCFAEHLLAHPDDPRAGALRAAGQRLIEKMAQYQSLDGGWGYLSLDAVPTYRPSFTSMSFTTATLLVGLERARQAGLELPQKMLERATASIARCKTPSGSFTYGELWRQGPNQGINQLKGAACRTPCCLEALALFGAPPPPAEVARALDDLLVRHARFQVASLRRPWPHESHYAISGYFYLYGYYYAALLLQRLPEAERPRYAPLFERALMIAREPDGSFWDYPLYSYHKPYGTAFALLTLSLLPPETAPNPE